MDSTNIFTPRFTSYLRQTQRDASHPDIEARISTTSPQVEAKDDKRVVFQFQVPSVAKFLCNPLYSNRADPFEQKPAAVVDQKHIRNSEISPSWLLKECTKHVESTGSALSPLELSKSILQTLINRELSEEELQMHLFDVVGFDGFEFITKLLENRSEFARYSVTGIEKEHSLQEALKDQPSGSGRTPAVASSINIQRSSDKQAQKHRRKQDRRAARAQKNATENEESTDWLAKANYDPTVLRNQRNQALNEGPMTSTSALKQAFGEIEGGFVADSGLKRALPEGTERTHFKGYEEVYVPPPKHQMKTSNERLIPIAELDDYAQRAFHGITHLNRLQSSLFEMAYKTSDNLLVCAPTGAGKTNVAMLTIMHEIGLRLRFHSADPKRMMKDFKIIYVAPMKALAQEVVTRFGRRLKPLHLRVAELTGDMQMSKYEIDQTHVIVTTPEKWDVITRKANAGTLVEQVKLIIIDEVHLLADGRGSVIETLVARTLRLVESTQSLIRIVGLSATLPNYKDVAEFLRVNPSRGLFYFNQTYRPVPLHQTFIGVTEKQRFKQKAMLNEIAYDKALDSIRRGHQVMIFVHSRKETAQTIRAIKEIAAQQETIDEFGTIDHDKRPAYVERVRSSRNQDLREFFESGFGIHHAGMLRADRNLTEQLFGDGVIKVLCCTATLAWGVNLPAHTVIIKGTQVYSAEKGGLMDLSMLDVMQIFGRAGRPQYDTSGEAIMITLHESLAHYLGLLMRQVPIESSFIKALPDQLNAEIVSGTVTNLQEAMEWLSYTYLFVRMKKNPMAYGITYEERAADPGLVLKKKELLTNAAKTLDECRMVRYDERSGQFGFTNLGRVSSHFYINHQSVETFNEMLKNDLTYAQIFHLICSSSEFDQIKVRDDELPELEKLQRRVCRVELKVPVEEAPGKTNALLQTYLSRQHVKGFTLISDTNYIVQNAGRVCRALFEIGLSKGWSTMAYQMLNVAKAIEQQTWYFQHPLRQLTHLRGEVVYKLEQKKLALEDLIELSPEEIGSLVQNEQQGTKLHRAIHQLPHLDVNVHLQPLSHGLLRLEVELVPNFVWNETTRQAIEPFWLYVEDPTTSFIYHSEPFVLHYRNYQQSHFVSFALPLFNPLPESGYLLHCISDRFLGIEKSVEISFAKLQIPEREAKFTEVSPEQENLPLMVLENQAYQRLYEPDFHEMNALQSHVFPHLYYGTRDIILSAPHNSGKIFCAELAMLELWTRMAKTRTRAQIVYLTPLNSVARLRYQEWKVKFRALKKNVQLLEGSEASVASADIVITTPAAYNSITRKWQLVPNKKALNRLQLVILDDLNLISSEVEGPEMEIVVMRLKKLLSAASSSCRFIGLTPTIANVGDFASWLDIRPSNHEQVFSLGPSSHQYQLLYQGFPDKHYGPRMTSMNKPIYAAIQQHSSQYKPALVFVSSRRQASLTAFELISFCMSSSSISGASSFLHMDEREMDSITKCSLRDNVLKDCIRFGIGIYHALLTKQEKQIVQELYANHKIQVLITTTALTSGSPTLSSVVYDTQAFKAHLVVIKGTEIYDEKQQKYQDLPLPALTTLLAKAGTSTTGTSERGIACLFVNASKKNYYSKVLSDPYRVESRILEKTNTILIHDILHQMVNGVIHTRASILTYLEGTFVYQRLVKNPSYYMSPINAHEEEGKGSEAEVVPEMLLEQQRQEILNEFVDSQLLQVLRTAQCVREGKKGKLIPTEIAKEAVRYDIHYQSIGAMKTCFDQLVKSVKKKQFTTLEMQLEWLRILSEADELLNCRILVREEPKYSSLYQVLQQHMPNSQVNAKLLKACRERKAFLQIVFCLVEINAVDGISELAFVNSMGFFHELKERRSQITILVNALLGVLGSALYQLRFEWLSSLMKIIHQVSERIARHPRCSPEKTRSAFKPLEILSADYSPKSPTAGAIECEFAIDKAHPKGTEYFFCAKAEGYVVGITRIVAGMKMKCSIACTFKTKEAVADLALEVMSPTVPSTQVPIQVADK